MAADFCKAVDLGLKLSKRIYYGKDPDILISAPPCPPEMKSEEDNYLPTAVMAYAEISDPSVVDNPDVPSYQPYVHGRCEPPVLIPLHMHGVSMEVDCYLDTALVTVSGAWRVHCVAASKSCCCRIALPIGEQGSVLGVEVESPLKSYHTKLTTLEATEDAAKAASSKDGFLIKGQIYTLKIPQVDGGTMLSIKVSWSQKLLYHDGQFSLNLPFSFPSYVIPMIKNLVKKEKIVVNINSGVGTEILCQSTNHPLKRKEQETVKTRFCYEQYVSFWSRDDFIFSYNISSNKIVGGILLQPPSLQDHDQREMFCFYVYPGKIRNSEVFKKEVIFLVDVSASMQGKPLENVKTALLASLIKLSPSDTFNVIAFNGKSISFSSSLQPATNEMIKKASEWIEKNFVAEGGTNISSPLNKAINMVSTTGKSLPIIFLLTDGAVEDEKDIINAMNNQLMKGGLSAPRICTFGIGKYCNHYFLQMLAQIGRGYYDTAIDIGSVNTRLERLISYASSVMLADIKIDALNNLDSLEIYPSHIPDLSSGCPLIISGRYSGNFPESVEVRGTLADLDDFHINVKVQNAKDIPIDKISARRQFDVLTAKAWFSENRELERKVTKLSLLTGVPSEYTSLILIETDKGKLPSKSEVVDMKLSKSKKKEQKLKEPSITYLRSLGIGFGNIEATAENRLPEEAEPKLYETSEMMLKVASHFCGKVLDKVCCMCFIQCCSRVNDQCAIALTQLCTALACFECLSVCCEVCQGD